MKKRFSILLILGLIASMLMFGTPVIAADQVNDRNFSSDRILVRFRAGTDENSEREVHNRHGGTVVDENAELGVKVVRVPAGQVQAKISGYRSEKNVVYAEPDYVAQAYGIPSDTYYKDQWGLPRINAPQAWDVTTGTAGVRIAILDTGVDQNHEDLAGKIVADVNFSVSSTVDDLNGHGTHVAGIAAAVTNNAKGVAGAGYNSSIMNVKVLDDKGSGYYSSIINGITWAANNGAKVISMSLGGGSPSTAMEDAINYAWGKGVVIVAAAGNSGSLAASYPAYYSNCIAVAATDSGDVKASWSNYGSWVDVAAPGVGIFSTLPNHSNSIGALDYGSLSGTSMATPFVAGEAALVWATTYGTSSGSVRSRVENTADNVAGTGSTYGRINVSNAVGTAISTPDFSLTATPTSRSVIRGKSAAYTVAVAPSGGFTGPVSFSEVSGLPAGATAVFNPASVTTSGSTTLTVKTSSKTTPATYTLTIKGTSGGLTRWTTVNLVVARR